jgi:hypothetical protein
MLQIVVSNQWVEVIMLSGVNGSVWLYHNQVDSQEQVMWILSVSDDTVWTGGLLQSTSDVSNILTSSIFKAKWRPNVSCQHLY